MTDLKGIEISDIAGISQPLVKLIDSISSACGKIYEPCHIKRMAKARAEEVKQITSSINDNPDLIVKYECGAITVENKSTLERAKQRFINQEIQKQENIDQIVAIAAKELSKETTITDDPVDKTWMLRFFKSIEDISDEELHIIWGKILAGEIKQPNTISLRTLNIIKNISKNEALLFNDISRFVFQQNNTLFLPDDIDLLEKHNIHYSDLLQLQEMGFIIISNTLIRMHIPEENILLFHNNNYCVTARSIASTNDQLEISAYLFTNAALELYHIINPPNNNNILKDYLIYLSNKESNLQFSIFKITEINKKENNILTEDNPVPDIDSI